MLEQRSSTSPPSRGGAVLLNCVADVGERWKIEHRGLIPRDTNRRRGSRDPMRGRPAASSTWGTLMIERKEPSWCADTGARAEFFRELSEFWKHVELVRRTSEINRQMTSGGREIPLPEGQSPGVLLQEAIELEQRLKGAYEEFEQTRHPMAFFLAGPPNQFETKPSESEEGERKERLWGWRENTARALLGQLKELRHSVEFQEKQPKLGSIEKFERETPPLDTKSVEWIAARSKNAKKFGLTIRTLRDYRTKQHGGRSMPDKTFGKDRDGRLWRRQGTAKSTVYYYAPSLRKSRK